MTSIAKGDCLDLNGLGCTDYSRQTPRNFICVTAFNKESNS